jgi:hypothetical protein
MIFVRKPLNLPAVLLILLLQRTPLLQLVLRTEVLAVGPTAGSLLRSAITAAASLGTLHTLAGASAGNTPVVTQLISDQVQPARATVGMPFSEEIAFYNPRVTILAASWTVTDSLPPGVEIHGAVLQGGKLTINTPSGVLKMSGTPTTPGTYTFIVTGYQNPDLVPPLSIAGASIVVAPPPNAAPTIRQQPSDQSVHVGGAASFSVLFSGVPAPTFQWARDGVPIPGATDSTLTLAAAATTDQGSYTVTLTNSVGNVVSSGARLVVSPVPVPPSFVTSPVGQTLTAGGSAIFSATVTGEPMPTLQWLKNGAPIAGATSATLSLNSVQAGDAGAYAVVATSATGTATSPPAALIVNPAGTLATQAAALGASLRLTASLTSNGNPTYQWLFNGANLAGATGASLALSNLQPSNGGLYSVLVTSGGATSRQTAIVGVASAAKVAGSGTELLPGNIRHPNGNTFDQVLLTGTAETITADSGQVTRTSFIDLNDDIVQIEFSGAGSLSIVLDQASGPAAPLNYEQPTVGYMKGHAGIIITGADETTNMSVLTVGRATAFDRTGGFNILQAIGPANNPDNNGSPLFVGRGATRYDGIADLAYIAISSPTGKFGGLRASNASFFATRGFTGIYAPGIAFQGPVFVGDINAFDAATPVLLLGSAEDVRITGGDLAQSNNSAVQVSGFSRLNFTAGGDSGGHTLPAQTNRAVLLQGGTDMTKQLVAGPGG